MASSAPIVLTTDFGTSDPYVGVMKGVILSINPRARIIDLTHSIQPQNIRQAKLVLGTSHQFFPEGAIHVVVVDPGVGTDRRAVALVTPTARFLAPDNGALSHLIRDYGRDHERGYRRDHLPDDPDGPAPESRRVPTPAGLLAYELANPRYRLHPVSDTFHGRDIFAPAAAHLSLGVSPEELGPPVEDLFCLAESRAARRPDGLHGEVIYVDHFGNLTTNISGGELAEVDPAAVEIRGKRITRLSRTFHDPESRPEEGLIALVGSHGYLEIAVQDGSAAGLLQAGVGEPVQVRLRA